MNTTAVLISAAVAKDGVEVAAVSVSEVRNSQGFGVINSNSPVSGNLKNLNQITDSAYACSLQLMPNVE